MSLPYRFLRSSFTGSFSADYFKLDEPIPGNDGVQEVIRFNDLRTILANGNGDNQANLLYQERYLIAASATRLYDLENGIRNLWNDLLHFANVKLLIIRNRNTHDNEGNLHVSFKNENYVIAPQGSRIIIEPYGKGILAAVSSSSSGVEGTLTITNYATDNPVEYDLIIVGSDQDLSSSTSG